jgi:phosphoribosyl-AMP cyclohydrolase
MSKGQQQKTKAETEKLISLCQQLKIRCDYMNAASYRLSRAGKVIDYYTKSKKCFWHCVKEWGQVENIEAFLNFEFKD